MMDCTFEIATAAIIVTAHGKVDESTWEAFSGHLQEGISRAVTERRSVLIVNLACLDYMSSRGLRALTVAKRSADAAGLAITLAAPNGVMREILAISRYDKLFRVEDSVELSL